MTVEERIENLKQVQTLLSHASAYLKAAETLTSSSRINLPDSTDREISGHPRDFLADVLKNGMKSEAEELETRAMAIITQWLALPGVSGDQFSDLPPANNQLTVGGVTATTQP